MNRECRLVLQQMMKAKNNEPTQPYNEIWYTSTNGKVLDYIEKSAFSVSVVSNTYNDGKGIIVFSGDVTSIGEYGFAYSSNLLSITLPYSVTSIDEDSFSYNATLSSITIPGSVTSIGKNAFRKCTSLADITIKDGVKIIGTNAFYQCSNIKSITIPSSVTSIGANAFSFCTSLLSVYCNPKTPPTLGSWTAFNQNASNRLIYVPSESVDAYKTASSAWSEWADYIVAQS